MNKKFTSILIRDLDAKTNEILNEVGEKIGKKSATDIIRHIIYQYPIKSQQIKNLTERVEYQSEKLSTKTNEIIQLQNKLDRIKSIC